MLATPDGENIRDESAPSETVDFADEPCPGDADKIHSTSGVVVPNNVK